MNTLLLTAGAGLLAGAMNALAGGGSFITLPALIAAGVPPVQANASSTVALFPGGMASAWAYRTKSGPIGSASMRSLLVATLSGGGLGGLLLLYSSPKAFAFALPWLLLLASVALAFGRRVGEALRARRDPSCAVIVAIQCGLGVYGGYFGGAVGIMMLAIWGLFDGRDLKSLNPLRTLLVSAANVAAVLIFIVADAVRWPETVAMSIGAILGGYGGAYLGRRAPPQWVRVGTLALTFGVTLAFFLRTYAFDASAG